MSLELYNLGKKIKSHWILKDINIKVNERECLALLGPSGCGKSSTLRLIAGLDKPDKGKIIINNKDVTNVPPLNRKISMMFQSYALYPHLNVKENLTLGLKVRGVSRNEQITRVLSILELMKLDKFANRKPASLSGGQRQRVALARALLRDPLVYLLDEPMSNLDAQLREELRPELRRLILKGDTPVIYVTHDQQEAMAMANRIAVLNIGKLEQIGTPKELYEKPNSIFVANFIGRPKINIFMDNNQFIGVRPEDIFFNSEGLKSKLIHREWLGSNQLLFLETEKGSIRMTTSPDTEIPERIFIKWQSSSEHIFNKTTRNRIN